MKKEVKIEHLKFEIVENFKCLSVNISNNDISIKVDHRGILVKHINIIKSKVISIEIKMRVYRIAVRSVAIYEAEIVSLLIFERKMLRRIYRP